MSAHSTSPAPQEYLQKYEQFKSSVGSSSSRAAETNSLLGTSHSALKAASWQLSSPSTLRVNQLDALLLNQAIDSHLENYLHRIIPTTHWLNSASKYALRIFIRYMCLVRMPRKLSRGAAPGNSPPEAHKLLRMTLGDQMQNLCYKASEARTIIFILVSVLGEGFFSLAAQFVSQRGWSDLPENVDLMETRYATFTDYLRHLALLYHRKAYKYLAWRLLLLAEKLTHIFSLLNFFSFLLYGRYRSLADRICGMRLHYARKLMLRQVSFDYMNRDLIWDGFAELILFVLPLINVQWIGRKLYQYVSSIVYVLNLRLKLTGGGSSSGGGSTTQTSRVTSIKNVNKNCPICFTSSIESPYIVKPCNHVYCYYCVKKQWHQDAESMVCTLCGESVLTIQRLSYDSVGNATGSKEKEA